ALAELYVLDKGDVPQLEPWSQDAPRFLAAEVPHRRNERGGIEELRRRLRTVGVPDQIGAELGRGPAGQVQTRLVVRRRGKWIGAALSHCCGLSGLEVCDSRVLPSS